MQAVLRDIVLVFAVAGGVLAIFHRLRLPVVVGLLFAGIIIGPHGVGVLSDRSQIEQLADLGILLLMFSIGLDFTPDRLRELLRAAGLGVAQMAICIVVTTLLAFFAVGWMEALFLGFLVAHTSSTLMLKLFLDRGEINSPPVRLGLGISITQDLSVVPMLLAVPIMAGSGDGSLAEFGFAILRVLGVLAAALTLSRWVIPLWLHQVVRSGSRELFLIFIVIVCLGTAWATLAVGLSVTLGAFLAGLAIAASAYSHQTLAEVVPFRDLLVSLFFISIGMLVDVSVLLAIAWPALLLTSGIIGLKFLSGFLPVLGWGYPLRIATLVGLGLAQIGEFSFVLAHAGRELGLMPAERFQAFVLVAILTMVVNPFLVAAGPFLSKQFATYPWMRRFEGRGLANGVADVAPRVGHVVIAGYGLNGQTVAKAMHSLGIPHAVLDLNPDSVYAAQQRGEAIYFGDCTRADVLRKVHVDTARAYVVAISDVRGTRQTVQAARHINPGLHIIARTKYVTEIDTLKRMGATEVISEEFETSLQILTRVLQHSNVDRLRISDIVDHFRGDQYEAFRETRSTGDSQLLDGLPAVQIDSLSVPATSTTIGKSLAELDLHGNTGATTLAVQRDDSLQTTPSPDFVLQANDLIVVAGTPQQLSDIARLVAAPPIEPASPAET